MKFAVLDFETTGDQTFDQIIMIGLTIVENDEIIDTYTTLINPEMRISAFITRLTGITNEMVANAPTIDQVLDEVEMRLSGCILVAHQASFDLAFLQRALSRNGYDLFSGRVLDTLDLLRILFPNLPSYKLQNVSQHFVITHDRPHQADSDAEATAHLLLRCLEKLRQLPLVTMQRLTQIFPAEFIPPELILASESESEELALSDSQNIGQSQSLDLGWFFQQFRLQKEMQPSLELDSVPDFRQLAVAVEDWSEEKPLREQMDQAEVLSQLGNDFSDFYQQFKPVLLQQFDQYEEREAQTQMIHEVIDSLEQQRHLMIEAGTGTGKSLGYLIPALYYGIANDSKIVVTTHTVHLQEQIHKRDVPLLKQVFPVPFRASVLKGRSHYLCLSKFEQKLSYRDFSDDHQERVTGAQILVWLGETQSGDEEELHFLKKGKDFWRTVESDPDTCTNRACPWFKKCYYHRARHQASISDVVITNHSLLFTDIKAEHRLLPAYRHLVVDEAHHFEEVASKHLGMEVSYYALTNTLTRLYKDSRNGQLPLLRFRLQRIAEEQALEWCGVIDRAMPKVVQIKETWDTLVERLYAKFERATQGEVGQYIFRLQPEFPPSDWSDILVLEENTTLLLTELLKALEPMLNEIKGNQEQYEIQSVVTNIASIVKDLYRYRDAIRFILRMNELEYVYWLEASPLYKAKSLQFIGVPADVSEMLKQMIFEVKDSVVLTSATLSVGDSFQYSCDQLGLDSSLEDGRLHAIRLTSPFNYREQALVCIPRDFPSVRGNADSVFLEKLVSSLQDVAVQTKGRMLVLFTSYRMLKQVGEKLRELLTPYGIQVYGQGIDNMSRSKLIRLFQESSASVLLGTSSFWEGVDIPGEALTCLAIVRLPFQPPNHPLIEAKCEALKKNNKNPFMHYSVPQAVIRFKQGFGRLIRTANDKGIVIVYDTRVIDTYYGKHFLNSLPGPSIENMPTDMMVPRIQEWMKL